MWSRFPASSWQSPTVLASAVWQPSPVARQTTRKYLSPTSKAANRSKGQPSSITKPTWWTEPSNAREKSKLTSWESPFSRPKRRSSTYVRYFVKTPLPSSQIYILTALPAPDRKRRQSVCHSLRTGASTGRGKTYSSKGSLMWKIRTTRMSWLDAPIPSPCGMPTIKK